MNSLWRGAERLPPSLPIGQQGRTGEGSSYLQTAHLRCASLKKYHVSDTSPAPQRAGTAQGTGTPARYPQKMHFNVTMTPAPWGFPSSLLGAAPGSAAQVGPSSEATPWGFTGKQLESTHHPKTPLIKSPRRCSTGASGPAWGPPGGGEGLGTGQHPPRGTLQAVRFSKKAN